MPRNSSILSLCDDFITGVSRFSDSYPGLKEPLARIYVPFRPEGTVFNFPALLDTGGHFCVLSPEAAEEIRSHLTDSFRKTALLTARGRVKGDLFRHSVDLPADQGEDLMLDATVFISPDWQGPSVLGYTGMLDRIRFAIDTQFNRFYFGPHG